jgi:hypothetical protein
MKGEQNIFPFSPDLVNRSHWWAYEIIIGFRSDNSSKEEGSSFELHIS